MPDTTQSEEFMSTTVNDVDFTIMREVVDMNDQSIQYKFTTEYEGELKTLQVTLDSQVAQDLEEGFSINAESELMEVLKSEIHAELNLLTSQ